MFRLRSFAVLALTVPALAQPARVLDGKAPFTDPEPARMLRTYLGQIAAEQLSSRKAQVAAISSRAQFDEREAEVRKTILRLIGGLPGERTPLNLRRVGRIDRGDYRVEKIIFESQPAFYVTANLYVPQTAQPPYPAVLHPTGHSVSAKARAFYQTLSLGLVKQGLVVLTYDPLGQGERRIYFDRDLEDSKVGSTTAEHSMAGIQSLLGGESIARAMIWDGMRGIDLLQSLPEVDPKRIGVTGCSGGGTLTTYLAALDDRLQAAAPACYISSWEDQLLGTGPQDAEQQFPDQLLSGLDHADFVTAFAPKPYLICSTEEDFFPIEGSRKTYEEARRIYGLYGAEDRIARVVGPGGHGTPLNVREGIYGWMKRWLKGDASRAKEPPLQTEYEEDLLSTPSGQVSTSLGGETVSTLNIRKLSKIAPSRPVANLKERVVRLTRYRMSGGPVKWESRGEIRRGDLRLERVVYETEPDRYVPALLFLPDPAHARGKTVLFADDAGKSGADAEELARLGYAVLAADLAGRGETRGDWGEDRLTWLALMVGRPLVGLHMSDISRGIDLLEQRNLLPGGNCIGVGKGLSAIDLLHAAVVDSRLSALAIEGALASYASVARNPIHRRIFQVVLPGVLSEYDLTDLAASLAPRPVWVINAQSPTGSLLKLEQARAEFAVVRARNVTVGLRREEEALATACPGLR